MPNQLNNYISDYLEYLSKDTNTATQTIKNYQFYLGRFMEATGATEPGDITPERVNAFLEFLKQIRNGRGELMKPSTQNYHLIALRSFLDYLKNNRITSLPAESVILNKTRRQPIMYLKGPDLEKLLEAPLHTKNSSIIQTRDKAMLELLFSTGLKVSEIYSLRRSQIKFNLNEISIPNDKNSSRTIPLTNLVQYWLKQYLESRTDSAPALFVRHDKAKKNQLQNMDYSLTPRTIQRIVKKYTKSTGLDSKITPQSLRHSYAHKQLALGADLKSLQTLLGHSSITTTRAYKKIKHD